MSKIKHPCKPYSRITTIDMWTDPYISLQMLNFHLNQSHDIASRRGQTINETIDFISNHVKSGSRLCDFGCGPGLYTDLLEKRGYKVIGCDVSKTSLDYAKRINAKIDNREFNYINDELDKKIDAAMMIYCDFGAMSKDSQCKFLHHLYTSLNDNGLFFFDICAEPAFDRVIENESETVEIDGFFMNGPADIITSIKKYPKDKVVLKYNKAKGQRCLEFFNWDKYYSIQEIEDLLHENGFKVCDIYSDTTGQKDFNSNDIYFIKAQKENNRI